jgi:hypothetical protein
VLAWLTREGKEVNEHLSKAGAIARIKAALRIRSKRTWSVVGGRGTSWGWITVIAPPKRTDEFGSMTADDQKELAFLFGLPSLVSHQGLSIPASSQYYQEFVDRAEGKPPSVIAEPYW